MCQMFARWVLMIESVYSKTAEKSVVIVMFYYQRKSCVCMQVGEPPNAHAT